MRNVWANVTVIGLSLGFLVHFALIAYYGYILIREPHPVVLALEMVMLVGIIVFAVSNLRRLR